MDRRTQQSTDREVIKSWTQLSDFHSLTHTALRGLSWWLSGKQFTYQAGSVGSIPGSERSPGGGNANPLQYSCLENSMNRGALQVAVHGVTESDTTEHAHTHKLT